MVGYGPEDDHFVAELTYNYSVRDYERGNSHIATLINSKELFEKFKNESSSDHVTISSPSGYNFRIFNRDGKPGAGGGVLLASSDLEKTKRFWTNVAQLSVAENCDKSVSFNYSASPDCKLSYEKLSEKIEHGKNYGRTALAWPTDDLENIEKKGVEFGGKVLTPLLRLATPGKADVVVVILADPDGHEVCFVGDEAFRDLSQVDPESERLIDEAIEKDKSNEWIEKRKKRGF